MGHPYQALHGRCDRGCPGLPRAREARNDDFRPDPDGQRFPDWKTVERTEPLLWKEAYALYEEENEPEPSSIKRQKGVLTTFFAFLGHEDMMLVTSDDAQRWVAHRLKKVSGRTVRYADAAHPSTLFNFCKSKKLVSQSPFDGIKVKYKAPPKLREREFTLAEAERILSASLRRGGSAANPKYKKVGEGLALWVRSKEVGVDDVGVDPNHGWRHLFRSAMLFADVQEQVINQIDGHKGATVGQRYGTAWPEVGLAAISKMPAYRLGGPA